jgi:hypothetical protein
VCPVASQQGWTRSCKPVPRAHDRLIAPDQRAWERSQNIIRSQQVRDPKSGGIWFFWGEWRETRSYLPSTCQRLSRHTLSAATGGPLSCDPSIPTADAPGHCPDLARGVSVWDDGAWAEGVPEAMAAPCAGSLLSLQTASPLGSMACGETTRLPSWGRQSNEGDTVVCSQTFSCHSMAQH